MHRPARAVCGVPRRGSSALRRPSQLGRYQFRSPSNFIVAGSRTPLIGVASITIAAASPTPICLNSMKLSVAKMENTATITIAALVTVPAVEPMPRSVGLPRSTSSFGKLGLTASSEDRRRVLAILRFFET
jgi:hypothetical protein